MRNSRPAQGHSPTLRTAMLLAATIGLSVALTGCVTSTPRGSAKLSLERPESEQIQWPEEFDPSKAAFFVHNQIDISATPEVVWNIITDVSAWPEWYSGASNVSILRPGTGRVGPDSVVSWRTMGLNFDSEAHEFEPPARFAWGSRKAVISGYHAWLIIPTAEGCRVITDGAFRGPLAIMQGTFVPNKLHGLHQEFLDKLKIKADARTALAASKN